MLTNIEQVIRTYIPNVIHMSLATSRDNNPWISELHYAYDDHLNLYFKSLPASRHCLELKENNKVSGNIIKQHVIGEKPRGVYFEGTCEVVENLSEESEAFKAYKNRFNTDNGIIDESKNSNGHQLYKISVSKFYVFDGIESSPSRKYELNWGDKT